MTFRKYRAPAGSCPGAGHVPAAPDLACIVASDQIHERPSRLSVSALVFDGSIGLPASYPIHFAVQSDRSSRPIDHFAGALHGETWLSRFQTRTFQKERARDPSGLPAYAICEVESESTLPESQRSP